MDRYPCSAAAFESSSWSFPFIGWLVGCFHFLSEFKWCNKQFFPHSLVSQTLQFFGGVPASILFLSLSYKVHFFSFISLYSCILMWCFVILAFLFEQALDAQKDSMSAKTAQMHRQMLKALILQLIVPFCTLFVPFTLLAYFVMMEAEFPGTLPTCTPITRLFIHIHTHTMFVRSSVPSFH